MSDGSEVFASTIACMDDLTGVAEEFSMDEVSEWVDTWNADIASMYSGLDFDGELALQIIKDSARIIQEMGRITAGVSGKLAIVTGALREDIERFPV